MEESAIVVGGRILVMDDDKMIRDLACDMLESIGYEVAVSMDGAGAIELYERARKRGSPFDAVIMDLTIPGSMGGREAIKKLVEIDPEVKAIASSGYPDDPVMSDSEKFGFTSAIAKPYRIKELGEILQKTIRG